MNIVQEAAMRSVWFMISEKYGKFSLILFTITNIIMLMGRTSKKQIDEVHFCTSSICCPLFYCLLLVIFVIPFVVVPIFGCIHPKITHEASEQKGNNSTKNGVERNPFIHIATIFILFPCRSKSDNTFLGVFRHFQGSPRLSVPFWLLRPLCVSYRLPRASILDIPVLLQAAGSLSGWCLSCVVGIVLA